MDHYYIWWKHTYWTTHPPMDTTLIIPPAIPYTQRLLPHPPSHGYNTYCPRPSIDTTLIGNRHNIYWHTHHMSTTLIGTPTLSCTQHVLVHPPLHGHNAYWPTYPPMDTSCTQHLSYINPPIYSTLIDTPTLPSDTQLETIGHPFSHPYTQHVVEFFGITCRIFIKPIDANGALE